MPPFFVAVATVEVSTVEAFTPPGHMALINTDKIIINKTTALIFLARVERLKRSQRRLIE